MEEQTFKYYVKTNRHSNIDIFGLELEEHENMGKTNCNRSGCRNWFRVSRKWRLVGGKFQEISVYNKEEWFTSELDPRIDINDLEEAKKRLLNSIRGMLGIDGDSSELKSEVEENRLNFENLKEE